MANTKVLLEWTIVQIASPARLQARRLLRSCVPVVLLGTTNPRLVKTNVSPVPQASIRPILEPRVVCPALKAGLQQLMPVWVVLHAMPANRSQTLGKYRASAVLLDERNLSLAVQIVLIAIAAATRRLRVARNVTFARLAKHNHQLAKLNVITVSSASLRRAREPLLVRHAPWGHIRAVPQRYFLVPRVLLVGFKAGSVRLIAQNVSLVVFSLLLASLFALVAVRVNFPIWLDYLPVSIVMWVNFNLRLLQRYAIYVMLGRFRASPGSLFVKLAKLESFLGLLECRHA